MNYQIQGLSIHAEEHGTGEPALVFLHYWGGTSRTWRQVTAELEGQFKTVAYDARGWGKSDKTLAGYKLADLAVEALSLVNTLGIKQYVLVGHSMGGKVAQLIASRRPEGLVGLILAAPAQPRLGIILTRCVNSSSMLTTIVRTFLRPLAVVA